MRKALYLFVLPQTHNPSLIKRKHQTNPNIEIVDKLSDQYSVKIMKITEYETVTDKRMRHDN